MVSWLFSSKRVPGLTDEELMQRYQNYRDPALAEELYLRFTHLVFGVCYRYLEDEEKARDAVMHVFEKLLTDPPEEDIRHVKNWMYTVAKNHCLVTLRGERTARRYQSYREAELEAEIMENASRTFQDTGNLAGRDDAIRKAVARLKEPQQQCIRLFYLEEKSYREITEITGYTLKQVKSYIQNGKRNLQMMLEHVRET